jgi:hypothetical protein
VRRTVLILSILGLAACDLTIPFNVNLIPFLTSANLTGTLDLPDSPVEIPPEVLVYLEPVDWRIPLHEFQVAVDITASLPSSPLTGATITIGISTEVLADGPGLAVDATADSALYIAPAGADPWLEEYRSSGNTITLGSQTTTTIEVPLSETQLGTLSAGPFTLGIELASGQIGVTGHPADLLTLQGFGFEIQTIRIAGDASLGINQ